MKIQKQLVLALLAGSALLSFTAHATQTGATHYISGEFADFATTVPTKPGWVLGNFTLNYNDGDFNASKGLPFGRLIAFNATVNMTAEVPLIMYAYPVDWLGATWASGVGVPFVWTRVKASGTVDRDGTPHSGTVEQTANDLGDIQLIPVMAGWTNGDFKFDTLLNVFAPTGSYNQDDLANCGLGYWTITPMAVVSWVSSKIGTEASVFTGFDFNTDNTDAHYRSGNLFHVDATVAQHFPLFGGFAGAGATAFWMRQISNDRNDFGPLVKQTVGGFVLNSYGIGPTISYAHPIGKHTIVFDASWLPQTYADNTTKGNFFWAKVMFAF